MKNIKQRLAMGTLLTGMLIVLAGTAVMAQDYRYNQGYRQWYQDDRRHGWREQNDWNRRHPSVYVAPGYVYYPPPVVYAPPPAHPGFNFYFGF